MKNQDFKQDITNKIIDLMQENGSNWVKCWIEDKSLLMPINAITKNHYQGINILSLWLSDKDTNEWGTYKQWQDFGKQVKKGEKSTRVLRYIQIEKDGENQELELIPIMKTFNVFNADQLEGYEPNIEIGKGAKFNHDRADEFITNTQAVIKNEQQKAFYSEMSDFINLPKMQDFIDTEDATAQQSYYSTLLHELTHWTGNKKRLDRKNSTDKKEYAFEELIAELGSCFLCTYLGTEPTIKKDHAKYLNGWIEILKDDNKAILKAASQAGKAFDFLLNLQTQKNQEKVA
ncbi:Antirestriction protein [uncultured Candidatus Thioglobus sp.]|nr:Antirestriction protein [uncultured Candidatus Thioglobus sp.]